MIYEENAINKKLNTEGIPVVSDRFDYNEKVKFGLRRAHQKTLTIATFNTELLKDNSFRIDLIKKLRLESYEILGVENL
ncbi:MAG TPA: hypothetical protein PKA63_09520 [Oligoflexia bacterium]|nr:hypothetical protein [Oligoflexia bacterium]HMP48893.1 hypothetical protein [Oligoflexia bacterium]